MLKSHSLAVWNVKGANKGILAETNPSACSYGCLRVGQFDGKRDLADILPSWALNFAVVGDHGGFEGEETYREDEDMLDIPRSSRSAELLSTSTACNSGHISRVGISLDTVHSVLDTRHLCAYEALLCLKEFLEHRFPHHFKLTKLSNVEISGEEEQFWRAASPDEFLNGMRGSTTGNIMDFHLQERQYHWKKGLRGFLPIHRAEAPIVRSSTQNRWLG